MIRIYDLKDNVLAVHLPQLIEIMGPLALESNWKIYPVKAPDGNEWFEVFGPESPVLESKLHENQPIKGSVLYEISRKTKQIIWGEFKASISGDFEHPWVTIRAIDSTFYEVETSDQGILSAIMNVYRDIKYDNE